jgi:hydroxymethylglutaryl-CoA lyase
MQDTKQNMLAIVANTRGAEEAVVYDEISYLGFPFSLSPTFQMRNTNSSMEESVQRVESILELCIKNNKELVVYLSMGFGNPYGDEYNEEILLHWANEMTGKGIINILSLADTVGVATPEQIQFCIANIDPEISRCFYWRAPSFHTTELAVKVDAAFSAGCKRFDGALKGIGGCPMAQDELVGNMDTELMIPYFEEKIC